MQNVSLPPASVPSQEPEPLPGIGIQPSPFGSHPYRPPPPREVSYFRPAPRAMPARAREVALAFALVVVADLAVFRGADIKLRGMGAAAFFVLVPALLLLGARARRFTVRLGVIAAMLLAVAARCAYSPTGSSVALGLVGIFALAITMRSRSSFLTDVAASFGVTFHTLPRRLGAFVTGASSLGARRGELRSGLFASISIPASLVGVFVTIFAFANPLVRRWIGTLFGSFEPPAVIRVLCWFPLALGAILLVRPGLRRTFAAEKLDETTESTPAALRIAKNALYALNVVFLGYNALDAKYLWAGSPPPGVSERVYAHEGAAWLTVAILALTIVVGVLFRGALAHDARARFARTLAFVWLGQGAIVALGTYRRLWIHIATSGLSSLRILGIVGTSLVVVALAQMVWKVAARRSFFWLLRRQIDAAVIGLFAFSVMPTHLISAPLNVRRVLAHDYQALVHAEEEVYETESATAMLPLLHHDDERIRRGIAALLLNERDTLRVHRAYGGLRDRELAQSRALDVLEGASPEIEAVLGDVDRSDAITPFEYIRNSSIEGEIAESEINKVIPAKTRSQKTIAQWIDERAAKYSQQVEVYGQPVVRETSDPNQLDVTIPVALKSFDPNPKTWNGEAHLVLVRDAFGKEWRYESVRGVGYSLTGNAQAQ